jgi:hypothetical protein
MCPLVLIVQKSRTRWPLIDQFLVGAVGVEPTTNGLKGRCSATELRPYFSADYLT